MLIVHLFVSYAHVNLCHFFSSSWCQGLTAASACGSSWTFLFTFFKVFYFDWHFCAQIWTSVAFILYIYITNRIPNHWYNVMSVLCMYLHICITYSLFLVKLFVSYAHVNLCHFFSSSWCQGLTAASACGSSWTFLFTFFKVFYFDWHFCAQIWTSVAFILYIYITNRIPNHWYNVMSVLCMYLHICITYSLFLVKFNLSVFKFSKMFHMDKKKTIKKSRVGKKWTSPVLPHPQFSNDCCLHHQSFRTLIFSA